MIDSDELLAIGAALVQTVRSQIKYSCNMYERGQLFVDLRSSQFFKNLITGFKYVRANSTYSPDNRGEKSLIYQSGLCDEISLACLYIVQGIHDLEIAEECYFTLMGCQREGYGYHIFILFHQSKQLFRNNQFIENSFDSLSKNHNLHNAVIIDPWIYKSTKLIDYEFHLEHAKMYSVFEWYKGIIKTWNNIDVLLPIYNKIQISQEYMSIFNEFYEIEKQKLANIRDSFARGRRFSSVRNDLILDVNRPHENQITRMQSIYRGNVTRKKVKQQQQLTSLRNFFTRLNNQSSYWYSHLGHSDNKGACINEAIIFLNDCIKDYNYPEEAKLVNLFQCILRILPIVRSSSTASRNLSIDTIDMTKSAKSIFNLAVTPQQKYKFEEIEGLDLDWIRNARNGSNERGKYKALLERIAEFTPYDEKGILPNFYEGKSGYYNLVRKAING